jgi:pimeloyl-ACP methyl ester carboxylesterase
MTFTKLLGVWTLALGITASQAQVIPPKKPPEVTTVPHASQVALEEGYNYKKDAIKREVTPRIVFVPGILGSQIFDCEADDSQCKSIWGTIEAFKRGDVDLSWKSDRRYRTDVIDHILFKDVYGDVLDYTRRKAKLIAYDRSDDALVTVFHYDWRRSNGENAQRLKERICKVQAGAKSSPIVIIAHSMGGLLTKVWAARHANEPCTSGYKPNVKQMVFVAAPHLGSPKAIKALAVGYNILFDGMTGVSLYLSRFERKHLLAAINEAGFSFASLYELLPIRTSEYCIEKKPTLTRASVPVVGDEKMPVNLFDVKVWQRYDLLRRIGAPAVRASYYEKTLAPLLHQAEQLLCEIADFDPATVADVVYLYGRQNEEGTLGALQLQSGAPDSILSATTVHGDGTVPDYSAQNILVSKTLQIEEVQADHASIISSATVRRLIDEMYSKAMKRADLDTVRANAEYASLLVEETAASGNLIPISLDPQDWSLDDEKLAIELNRKALGAMGYQIADVARIASRTPDPFERAKLYAVAASNADEPSQRLSWIAEAARSSYDAGQFQLAIRNSAFVSTTVETALSSKDPKAASLKRAVNAVEGWAYLRVGDVKKFDELASSYAAKYGVEFKEPMLSGYTAVTGTNSTPRLEAQGWDEDDTKWTSR